MKWIVLVIVFMFSCGRAKPVVDPNPSLPSPPLPPPVIIEPEDGQKLFLAKCSRCHSESELAGVSPAQIQGALRSVIAMNSVRVSQSEIFAISDYLAIVDIDIPDNDDDDDDDEDDEDEKEDDDDDDYGD